MHDRSKMGRMSRSKSTFAVAGGGSFDTSTSISAAEAANGNATNMSARNLGNPKPETRSPKETRFPSSEVVSHDSFGVRFLPFEFLSDLGFPISGMKYCVTRVSLKGQE